MIDPPLDAIVIGAGLSGLIVAGAVRASGGSVLVLEKSRGLGGRLATRRSNLAVFDHGAQFFTARDPEFRSRVEAWQAAGVVRPWSEGFALADGTRKHDGLTRYCGVKGMAGIAKHLAEGLDVRVNSKVTRIQVEHGGWIATTETGERHTGRALVVTAPVPQSLQLLVAGAVPLPESTRRDLEAIRYAPCLAVLAQFATASLIPEPGGLWFRGGPIGWMADNTLKKIAPGPGAAVTLHASPEFSQSNWAAPEAEVTATLLAAAAPWLDGPPLETQLQRWRYSLPLLLHPERCVVLTDPAPLVFAGDAFGGPRVEGAALSGLAAGAALVDLLHRGGSQNVR